MKKTIASIMVIMVILAAFSGCEPIRTNPMIGKILPGEYIIGTWIGTKEFALGDVNYTFTFNKDGSGFISTPGIDLGLSMSYTIDGDQLSIMTDTFGITKTDTYKMDFEEGKLLLTVDDTTITLTRQE